MLTTMYGLAKTRRIPRSLIKKPHPPSSFKLLTLSIVNCLLSERRNLKVQENRVDSSLNRETCAASTRFTLTPFHFPNLSEPSYPLEMQASPRGIPF